jgi:hypothetical protein
MTVDDAIAYVGEVLRQRRELTAIARNISAQSATFHVEWRATVADLVARLEHLARLEAALEPVLAPPRGVRFTLEQLAEWLQRMKPAPVDARLTAPIPYSTEARIH